LARKAAIFVEVGEKLGLRCGSQLTLTPTAAPSSEV
jgi:hypothetical protein